jgi:hypothetical protein
VYTVDPATGAATLRSQLTVALGAGAGVGAGFNPVADRLRIHTDAGQNLRVDVETGATTADAPLAYAAGDVNAGRQPAVVATAYTNSASPAPATTQLYAVDVAQDVLVRLDAPNDGQLRTVGRLVVDNDARVGFDIPGRAADRTGYATFTRSTTSRAGPACGSTRSSRTRGRRATGSSCSTPARARSTCRATSSATTTARAAT